MTAIIWSYFAAMLFHVNPLSKEYSITTLADKNVAFAHVISRFSILYHVSVPFGLIIVGLAAIIVNLLSLMSYLQVLLASSIFTKQLVEGVLGIFH